MDRKDYLSDNLRDISDHLRDVSKNGANLPVYNPYENSTNGSQINESTGEFNKAQERRLSDVYKAKLDIIDRISRTITIVNKLNEDEIRRHELRAGILTELNKKLLEAKELHEPNDGKDLLNYIRKVEHLRMEFFTYETQIDKDMYSSNLAGLSANNSVDVKYFYKLAKLIVILLIALTIAVVGAAIIIAVTIWLSMKV